MNVVRPPWPGNQQGLQRQLIQLDAQTHAHLQTLDPIQKAEYLSKLHKRNLLFRQQQQGGWLFICYSGLLMTNLFKCQ